MKVSLALTLDNRAENKRVLITELFLNLNKFIVDKKYGSSILEYLVICQIVSPPHGYEHLFKTSKPKFINYKLMTNRLTGEKLLIEKQYSYYLSIKGEKFERFAKGSAEESKFIVALEFLNSLSNKDNIPIEITDFDYEKFKSDVEQFFQQSKIF